MLKWFSGEEGEAGSAVSPEMAERLIQTEQLVSQLKELIREKDAALRSKDDQLKELTERLQRLTVERESLESKMEAEKHVMRAQLRDLMEKHQVELQRLSAQHQGQMERLQTELLGQLEERRTASPAAAPPVCQEASGSGNLPTDPASIQRMAELEAQAKQKTEEASRSEAKFLKMKAWSKSRIRQLEEELKKSQAGVAPPDLTALRGRITALEEEREENQWKVDQYEELRAKSEMLEAKLVSYEEQQRTLQAELEQFTKRAASQASESGSADDTQSKVLEWQEMVAEAASARDRAREEREERAAMSLRLSHMEEEREGETAADDWFFPGCSDPALATRQQELEEELAQARGLARPGAKNTSESTTPMEGENMGGWWPEYSSPDTDGLRSVVEELELERNQLQEQILSLEERCQDLEDRLQLQARIEALQVTFDVDEEEQPCWVSQNETEKLQSQLAGVRSQHSRDAEKHQLLVNSLSEQLKGLSDTQESLESSLVEKENTLAKTTEKLELIDSLRETLSQREIQVKELSDKLLQTDHSLENVTKRCSSSEKQCSELKSEAADLTQKLSALKEKAQKQDVTIETLQAELDQTSEELDKLNSAHLEERAQLIHDLQSCEREIDSLKDVLLEKDREISSLAGNMAEYAEQLNVLKQEVKEKEESLVQVENALRKAEREATVIRDSQNSDQQTLNSRITELMGKLKDAEAELEKTKEEGESKAAEVEHLLKQAEGDKKTIQELRGDIQKLNLKDKEQIQEKELKSSKDEQNKLLTQVEKYGNQVETLSGRLEEKLEAIRSLEDQIRTADKLVEEEKQKFDSEKVRLNNEIQNKSEGISKVQEVLRSTETQKQELEVKLKGLNEELELQRRQTDELHERATAALQLNGSLEEQLQVITQHRDKLQLEASERIRAVSEATAERDSLQTRISALETQLSDSNRVIEGLQRERGDLNQVIEQSNNSNSELLLEKTNECSRLLEALREKEEEATRMRLQVEKTERTAADLQSKTETQQSLAQIIHLTADNQRLQEELGKNIQLVSDLTAEKSFLQEKASSLENQIQDSQKTISAQTEEREELRKILTESQESNAAGLLEKTNECTHLSRMLRETEEHLQSLQEQVSQLTDAEKTVSEQRAQLEARQDQLLQLQDTVSMLQEQGSVLKAALMEKDSALNQTAEERRVYQNELLTQRELASKLQEEAESVRRETSEIRQQLEQKEQEVQEVTEQLQSHREELKKRSESVFSLSSQIGAMNQSAAEMEAEISSLKASLQKLSAENEQQLQQSKAEVTDLRDSMQALTDQNRRLKAELQKMANELELIGSLRAEISDREKELRDVQSEVETMRSTMQEKDENLEKLQAFIQQQDQQLRQVKDHSDTLKKQLSELQETTFNLRGQVETLTSESGALKNSLEKKEQLSLQYQSHSTTTVENLNSHLQGKEAECHSLKERISHLEESVSKLSSSLQVQASEAERLRATLGEKDAKQAAQLLSEMQKLEERNKSLSEELRLSGEEHRKLQAEREELEQSRHRELQENQSLQAKVSAKDQELSLLKENIQKIEQILQDSEKEWLSLLDREKQDKSLLTEQLEHLQRCVYEIQQRDQYFHQLNTKLQQAVEERAAVAGQLRAVSQTLRDSQNRCHWLESQIQGQVDPPPHLQPSLLSVLLVPHQMEAKRLKRIFSALFLSLADERARRESAEEALRLAEDRVKSAASRDNQRDFSIEMEEEEWEALSLNPNQPLITRKVKGGMVACRRWLRGRSLYFSRLLTGRARSRYFFLAYLLTIHVAVLMCLSSSMLD
uniref:Golgin subfamily B member 1-like n=1 Tax=Poecilia reticulata TaxID=8081 RepID=A0A3P9PPC8_POERE